MPAFGDRGVEFFFLISGFLIGLKYYDSGKMNNLRQTLRYTLIKGKKIYPLYLLTIVPMLVFLFKSWKVHEIKTVKLVSIFIFFRIIKKIGSKSTIVILFLIEFIWEFFVLNCLQNQVTFLIYSLPVYRAIDFGIGIILGVLGKSKEKKDLDKMLALLLIVYVIMIVVFDKKFTYSIYHVIEALLVWIVVMNSGSVSKSIFENPLLVKIGNISEVIFLTHLPIITYMRIMWEKIVGNQYRFVEWIMILFCIFVTAYGVSYIQKMIQVKKQCKLSI